MSYSKHLLALALCLQSLNAVSAGQPPLPPACVQTASIIDTCYREFDETLRYSHPEAAFYYKTFLTASVEGFNKSIADTGFSSPPQDSLNSFLRWIYQFMRTHNTSNLSSADLESKLAKMCIEGNKVNVQQVVAGFSRVEMLTGSKSPKCVKVMRNYR